MRHYHDHNGELQETIIGVQFVHLVLEVNPIRPHRESGLVRSCKDTAARTIPLSKRNFLSNNPQRRYWAIIKL